MKTLLAILCLLPTLCFAQGFGNFRTDQPFLGQDATSAASALLPVAEFNWTYTNQPAGDFTYWPDNIHSNTFTPYYSTTVPVFDATGLYWQTPTTTRRMITNQWWPDCTNRAIAFIIRWDDNGAAANIAARSRYADSYFNLYKSVTTNLTYASSDILIPKLTFGQWYDLVMVCSNGGGSQFYWNFWTNGQVANSRTAVGNSNYIVVRLGAAGNEVTSGSFQGYIKELSTWTNVIDWSLMASNFHYYATNTYGYTP